MGIEIGIESDDDPDFDWVWQETLLLLPLNDLEFYFVFSDGFHLSE